MICTLGSWLWLFNTEHFQKEPLAVACTVFPDLNNKELQDSYKVMGADVLLKTMLTPGEYADYVQKVQEVCGFDTSLQDEVDEAKN
jgi:hypothetical protein